MATKFLINSSQRRSTFEEEPGPLPPLPGPGQSVVVSLNAWGAYKKLHQVELDRVIEPPAWKPGMPALRRLDVIIKPREK